MRHGFFERVNASESDSDYSLIRKHGGIILIVSLILDSRRNLQLTRINHNVQTIVQHLLVKAKLGVHVLCFALRIPLFLYISLSGKKTRKSTLKQEESGIYIQGWTKN